MRRRHFQGDTAFLLVFQMECQECELYKRTIHVPAEKGETIAGKSFNIALFRAQERKSYLRQNWRQRQSYSSRIIQTTEIFICK